MMSLESIVSLREEAAQRARRRGDQPRVFFNQADVDQNFGKIPNFGDYQPKGWTLAEEKMCDSSGFGAEDEPALTPRQYRAWLSEHLNDGSGFAITTAAQFQVIVSRFTPDESPAPTRGHKKKKTTSHEKETS